MAREGHEFVDSQNVAREKLRKEYVNKKWGVGKGSSQKFQCLSYDGSGWSNRNLRLILIG